MNKTLLCIFVIVAIFAQVYCDGSAPAPTNGGAGHDTPANKPSVPSVPNPAEIFKPIASEGKKMIDEGKKAFDQGFDALKGFIPA